MDQRKPNPEKPVHVFLMKAHPLDLHHVWRRFLIPENASLKQLHDVITCLFDLNIDNPYVLRVGGTRYTEGGSEDEPGEDVDLDTVPLRAAMEVTKSSKSYNKKHIFLYYRTPLESRKFFTKKGEHLFEYEDEDDIVYPRWDIVISFEDMLPAETGRAYPVCIEGKRATPPRCFYNWHDYRMFLDRLKGRGRSQLLTDVERSGDPEIKKYVPLLEKGFDPAAFDMDTINGCLSHLKRK